MQATLRGRHAPGRNTRARFGEPSDLISAPCACQRDGRTVGAQGNGLGLPSAGTSCSMPAEYRRSAAGRRLLAHELAHVVQQSAAPAVTLRRARCARTPCACTSTTVPIIFVQRRPIDPTASSRWMVNVLIGAPPSATQESTARAWASRHRTGCCSALQLLSQNRAAASTLSSSTAVDRLLAYAPPRRGTGRCLTRQRFVREVLRESGWSQTAQIERLPVGDRTTAVDKIVNPRLPERQRHRPAGRGRIQAPPAAGAKTASGQQLDPRAGPSAARRS